MSKSTGLSSNSYVWGAGGDLLQEGGSSTSYIYGPGGMLVEQIQVQGQSSTPYYYHADQLGSVRAITNSSGSVANTYTYDAYGNTSTSTGTVANPFKYSGQYTDSETGFLYLRARYYDPATQQFLSVDPLLASTEQAYAYVGGSPVNGIDPSGLCAAFPNPFDPNSCMVLGAQTEAGHWVIAGGVAAAAVATGGFICVAGGCEAAGAALGIGGTAAAAPELPAVVNDLAPATEDTVVNSVECDVQGLQFSQTVSNHLQDLSKQGTLARPYTNSRLLIQEIMNSGPPSTDPQGALNRWYWRVPGFMGRNVAITDQTMGNRTVEGWWELLINPNTNTIEHFLFKR